MPYIVNETSDNLRLPGLGRVLPAGSRSDQIPNPVTLTAEQAEEFAGNPNLAVFADDGTRIPAPPVDWSKPKPIVLDPAMFPEAPGSQPAEDTLQPAPVVEETVDVPAGEHVEIVPDATNGDQK